ncbi:MAG: CRTAC1 family protein [Pirellulaceae bacterium]|nr:CRTAC1 family protein [Pirellulaceae bacterium]MDP7018548.1 CRTAC1 family protein [Pirellulaceae bacterium]
MTQPLDRSTWHDAIGEIDYEHGEIWFENPFEMAAQGQNLSAFERNRVYLNLGAGGFLDASFASRADIDSDSRSVIAADFDRDGRPDLLVGSVGGGSLRLFLNRIPNQRRLRIELVGKTSNRLGIGSRVTAHVGDRQVIRDLFPPNGFMGQGPAELDIGLGGEQATSVSVRWPSGAVQTVAVDDGSTQLRIVEE